MEDELTPKASAGAQPASRAEVSSRRVTPGDSFRLLSRCLDVSPPDAQVMLQSDNGWDELRWAAVLPGKCLWPTGNNPFEDSLVLSSERPEPDPRYENATWPFRDDKTWEGHDPVTVLELRRYLRAVECWRDPWIIPVQSFWYNKSGYEFSLLGIGQILMAYSRNHPWRKFFLLNLESAVNLTLPTSIFSLWWTGEDRRAPNLLQIDDDQCDCLTVRDASVTYEKTACSTLYDRVRRWIRWGT